jgi:putative pyridoxal-dependent aspartate 1-decarboxylase
MAIATASLDHYFRNDILNLFRGNRLVEGGDSRRRLVSELQQFHLRAEVCSSGAEPTRFDTPAGSPTPGDYYDWLNLAVLQQSANLMSPLCMGHMSGPVPEFAGVLSEFVGRLNQNLVKREASPALTILERQTLAALHRLVYEQSDAFYGLHGENEESALGITTSGGTMGNLVALWIARNACLLPADDFSGIEDAGLGEALAHYGYDGAVIIGSRLMHYSIDKAAAILGLGSRALRRLPLDAENRLDMVALKDCLADCRARRQCVLAVVGVAGATDCGSIDPLNEIGAIAAAAGAWFHVDAAWAGPLLFSARHRSRLSGIGAADSVTIDPHKQMYTPLGASVLLLKKPAHSNLIERRSHYMLQNGSGDLGQRALEGSRGGALLFVHAALSIIGADGYGLLMDQNLENATTMAELIRGRNDFELLFEPATNILLYRYLPEYYRARALSADDNLNLNQFNEKLQKAQSAAGRTFVSRTTVENTRHGSTMPLVALRAITVNPLLEEHHMRMVLEDQAVIGAGLASSCASLIGKP